MEPSVAILLALTLCRGGWYVKTLFYVLPDYGSVRLS